MNDAEFRSRLEQDVYGNQAMSHIFIEYDEKLLGKHGYNLNKLINHNKNRPTLGFMQEGIVHFTLNLPGAFPGDFDI